MVCGQGDAAQRINEAKIDEERVPSSHPNLIPGLALASNRTGVDLREALVELCASGGELSYDPAESWESATFNAHTVLFTTSERRECTLYKKTIAVTVGNAPDASPRYALRGRLPYTHTPIGDCDTQDTWREETILAGAESAVRLVLVVDRAGDEISHSQIVVRRASAGGWNEQLLIEPAPRRYVGGRGGPKFDTVKVDDDYWVVSSHDRTDDTGVCKPIPGQVVWTWSDGWRPVDGRKALAILADHGLWRYAGQDAWFLVLAQDDPLQADDVQARMGRMARKSDLPLHMLDSADFPGLNAGHTIVTPDPFTSEEEAKSMRHNWGRRAGAYVKKAWDAKDPCD